MAPEPRALGGFDVAFAERGSVEEPAPPPQRLWLFAVHAVLFGLRRAGSRVCSLFVPHGKSLWLMSNCFRGRGGGYGGCE